MASCTRKKVYVVLVDSLEQRKGSLRIADTLKDEYFLVLYSITQSNPSNYIRQPITEALHKLLKRDLKSDTVQEAVDSTTISIPSYYNFVLDKIDQFIDNIYGQEEKCDVCIIMPEDIGLSGLEKKHREQAAQHIVSVLNSQSKHRIGLSSCDFSGRYNWQSTTEIATINEELEEKFNKATMAFNALCYPGAVTSPLNALQYIAQNPGSATETAMEYFFDNHVDVSRLQYYFEQIARNIDSFHKNYGAFKQYKKILMD